MKESVLMVQTNNSQSLQQGKFGEMFELISADSTQEALKLTENTNNHLALIILGPDIKDPIQTCQRLHGLDKSLSVIILTTPENLEPMRRSIHFTPFLGHSTLCLSESNFAEIESESYKAITRTIKYRQARSISSKLNSQLSGIKSQNHKILSSSKEYLERLFDSAPIGIITLSADGFFLALNRAASEMFRISEREFIGASINEIFPDLNLVPDRVELISRKVEGVQRYFELTITTVRGQDQSPGYLLLVVDITDRKNYEKALESAVRSRDEFLSIASHELKTPITSLQLQLQITKKIIGPSDISASATISKVSKYTDGALLQVRRLTMLVEDLLDVSKIESGKLNFNYTLVDLNLFLKEVAERLSLQCQNAKCSLAMDLPEKLTLVTDSFRLDQVITNLMMNAFKYASGSSVELKVTDNANDVIISIKDYGEGIEPAKLPLIFNRFERGVSNNNISGLGLGLYITKSIVETLGGTISVESIPGKGTTFTVELPKRELKN